MHVKIFMQSAGNFAERDLLHAMGTGIERVFATVGSDQTEPDVSLDSSSSTRYRVDYVWDDTYTACDVAVIYGSWKPREKSHHVIRNSVAQQALRFLVIETALLDRRTDRPNRYWRVGINGYLGRDARWPVLSDDAADERLEQIGIEPWQDWNHAANGHVLLGLQIPGDASLRGTDIYAWARHVITELRLITDRRIVIRPHPLASDKSLDDLRLLAGEFTLAGVKNLVWSQGRDLAQDLRGAYCTVVYSSGMAIDSVLAGVPVICGDSANFAWPVSGRSIKDIDNLRCDTADRVQAWLRRLAACQWTDREMQSGECFEALVPILETL